MEQFKEEIESLKDLGFEYPLRANLDFNRFQIYDKVNRLVYPPHQSGSLAWKEKERKFIQYVVKLLNAQVKSEIKPFDTSSQVKQSAPPFVKVYECNHEIKPQTIAPVVKRRKPPKGK